MSNYADLLQRAVDYRVVQKDVLPNRMVHASAVLTGRELVKELTDALITVCQQNRNLRHDLEQTKRDYEANLNELLETDKRITQLVRDKAMLMEKLGAQHKLRIVEVIPEFREVVALNDGYCPCMIEKSEDTKCMCKEFREQETPGPCHCGRFEKVLV